MKGASALSPSPVRLPPDLRDWLKHKAIDNRRSFSNEVAHRLEDSRRREESSKKQGAAQ